MKHRNFKKDLDRLAHLRGRRPRLQTKVVDKKIHARKNELRYRDEMDELDELRKQGIRIG